MNTKMEKADEHFRNKNAREAVKFTDALRRINVFKKEVGTDQEVISADA